MYFLTSTSSVVCMRPTKSEGSDEHPKMNSRYWKNRNIYHLGNQLILTYQNQLVSQPGAHWQHLGRYSPSLHRAVTHTVPAHSLQMVPWYHGHQQHANPFTNTPGGEALIQVHWATGMGFWQVWKYKGQLRNDQGTRLGHQSRTILMLRSLERQQGLGLASTKQDEGESCPQAHPTHTPPPPQGSTSTLLTESGLPSPPVGG